MSTYNFVPTFLKKMLVSYGITIYYMRVRVMRWDNIMVVYGVLFYGHKWVQFEAQGPAGPEGIKLKPRVPIEVYSRTQSVSQICQMSQKNSVIKVSLESDLLFSDD